MLKNKLFKNLALVVAACSLVNVMSFGALAAESGGSATTTYDFNDGTLPDVFDSDMFTVEDGMLKANSTSSGFEIGNMSKNYSAEFKIKPLAGGVEQAFNLFFGNVKIFFDGANGKNSSWNDSITLSKRKDGAQINKLWSKYFQNRTDGHTVKVVVNSNMHSFYIDNALIISGECKDEAGSNSLAFSLSQKVSDSGVYIDDIVITKLADMVEVTTSGCLYAYNFNDGQLPPRFDSTKFSIENNMLKANGTGSEFSFTEVPKNSTIEFDIKPLAGKNVPGFYLEVGNMQMSYEPSKTMSDRGWNDQINVYNRVDWNEAQSQKIWADGQSGRPSGNFFPSANGHKVKVVSYGDKHSIYIDDVLMGSGELTGKLNAYTVKVGIGKLVNEAVYFDNILIKDSREPYNFDFNDGVLPEMFDSTNFDVVYNKLYVRGAGANFEFKEIPGDCSVEFKVKPFAGEHIPYFSLDMGKASFSYASDNSTNPNYTDVIRMYNRINWGSAAAEAWANGKGGNPDKNFFPSADGYTLKYIAKGNNHQMYIDGRKVLDSELTGENTNRNIKLAVGSKALSGMYIDDIKVNLLDYDPEFKAAVSANGDTKTCNVTIKNIDDENALIFAAYKDGYLENIQIKDCTSDSEIFTTDKDVDTVQVMIWNSTEQLIPVYDAIVIPQSEWTAVSE